jgi:tRNA C32,U32 (ribose-2'-O)-methylase TrmJ
MQIFDMLWSHAMEVACYSMMQNINPHNEKHLHIQDKQTRMLKSKIKTMVLVFFYI